MGDVWNKDPLVIEPKKFPEMEALYRQIAPGVNQPYTTQYPTSPSADALRVMLNKGIAGEGVIPGGVNTNVAQLPINDLISYLRTSSQQSLPDRTAMATKMGMTTPTMQGTENMLSFLPQLVNYMNEKQRLAKQERLYDTIIQNKTAGVSNAYTAAMADQLLNQGAIKQWQQGKENWGLTHPTTDTLAQLISAMYYNPQVFEQEGWLKTLIPGISAGVANYFAGKYGAGSDKGGEEIKAKGGNTGY